MLHQIHQTSYPGLHKIDDLSTTCYDCVDQTIEKKDIWELLDQNARANN